MVDEKSDDSVKWEYFILQVNLDNNSENNEPSSEIASQKLQGSLSPDFIKEQFPEQYNDQKKPIHPVNQLQKILNKVGDQGWEMVETTTMGKLYLFIFKKRKKSF
tara:strand:- start:287 stop:601 length:315 start_codon:yes stop_codon:yes gene_type:complete